MNTLTFISLCTANLNVESAAIHKYLCKLGLSCIIGKFNDIAIEHNSIRILCFGVHPDLSRSFTGGDALQQKG